MALRLGTGGHHFLTLIERIGLVLGFFTVEGLDAKYRTDKFLFELGQLVLHGKTNRFYVIVGLPNVNMIEATGEPCYIYREHKGFMQYSRSRKLMEDGRFSPIEHVG